MIKHGVVVRWRARLYRMVRPWVDRRLVRLLPERPQVPATVSASATLAETARIENASGDPTRISIGDHSFVRGRLFVYGHGGRLTIGTWCYVGVRSEIWSMNEIHIGDRVLIAHDVNVHDGTGHSLDHAERHAHFRSIVESGHPRRVADVPGVRSAPIVIEDDVWISFGVTVLKGVRIGARSVIAAGSVVADDVPPDVLYRCQVTPVIEPLRRVSARQ
jgi:acetyltransferase-like isoleucine patch superfamily enzyme